MTKQQDQLYQELFCLRQTLKLRHKAANGRGAVVCSDEALENLAKYRPLELNDLGAVPGIGSAFVENYGEQFIQVIRKHCQEELPVTVPITDETAVILKELEKKLVQINQGQKLLYFPKLHQNAIDLI